MDAFKLVFEAEFYGDRLLRELHKRGVGRERVYRAVAGALRKRRARDREQADQATPHSPHTHPDLLYHPETNKTSIRLFHFDLIRQLSWKN